MVGYSADDYLRFSADKETIYYSEPVYACEDAYVLPTNDNSEQWGVRSDGHWTYVNCLMYSFPPQGWKIHISANLIDYQSILDNYTQKLKDATPGLVDEFNKEASEKSRDVNALAGICNSKVEKLAEICNTGVGEMADLMNKNGDDYSKYEEWAKKLQDVYATQSKEIQDAYTSVATGQ